MTAISRLITDRRGVAFTEFALALPVFLIMLLGGAEVANYMTTRMRVSQLALHIADHAARMGSGTQLAAKQISERQINDVLTGAGLQSGELDLYGRGRVVLSSLEPVATPNTTSRFRIAWQRCRGSLAYAPVYGTNGQTNMTGMGPAGSQVTAMEDNATMFVEVRYDYRPLVVQDIVDFEDITETAAMVVRDRRDRTKIYNTETVTKSTCS